MRFEGLWRVVDLCGVLNRGVWGLFREGVGVAGFFWTLSRRRFRRLDWRPFCCKGVGAESEGLFWGPFFWLVGVFGGFLGFVLCFFDGRDRR